MKSKKKLSTFILKILQISLVICAALGWWGLIYPELTLTPDTYQVFYRDKAVQQQQEVVEWDFDSTIYMDVLNADSSQIRFRSKLFEMLQNWW